MVLQKKGMKNCFTNYIHTWPSSLGISHPWRSYSAPAPISSTCAFASQKLLVGTANWNLCKNEFFPVTFLSFKQKQTWRWTSFLIRTQTANCRFKIGLSTNEMCSTYFYDERSRIQTPIWHKLAQERMELKDLETQTRPERHQMEVHKQPAHRISPTLCLVLFLDFFLTDPEKKAFFKFQEHQKFSFGASRHV